MTGVFVTVPLELTSEMIRAVRDDPTTSVSNNEDWYARLGWLICAWEVLLKNGPPPPVAALPPITKLECSKCK